MDWKSAPAIISSILRISVGGSVLLMGISGYRDFAPFVANVTDGLGWMTVVGTVWAYLLPAFMIFGGGLLAVGRYPSIAAWTGGIALGSVPLGLMLKTLMTGSPMPTIIDAATPALLWIIVFTMALGRMPDQLNQEL